MSKDQQEFFLALKEHGIERFDEDQPLYKYVDIKTARLIIGSSTIKFSTPYELDDNDMEMALLYPNITDEQKLITTKDILLRQRENKKIPNFILREEKIDSFSERLSNDTFKSIIMNGYAETRKTIGIFCLSKRNDNDMMWSKYADDGKGVCIEFRFPTLFNQLFYGMQVCYNEEFKALDLFESDGTENPLAIHRWVLTKREPYKTEDEVRLISYNLKGIVHIDRTFITNIYCGKYTSKRSIRWIEWMLSHSDYSFKKVARISK